MTRSLMEIPENRDVTAQFHLAAGIQWLEASDGGNNTNALVYCGFEFRLALERIGLELLMHIRRGQPLEKADYEAVSKLQNIQRRIYQLVGHDKKIKHKVEFGNIIMEAFDTSFRIAVVNLGEMMKHWHGCSELCHMQIQRETGWGSETIRQGIYAELNEIKVFIESALTGLSWSRTEDPAIRELEARYVEGSVTREDVLSRLKEIGVYGILTQRDGTKTIVPGLKPGSYPKPEDGTEAENQN